MNQTASLDRGRIAEKTANDPLALRSGRCYLPPLPELEGLLDPDCCCDVVVVVVFELVGQGSITWQA